MNHLKVIMSEKSLWFSSKPLLASLYRTCLLNKWKTEDNYSTHLSKNKSWIIFRLINRDDDDSVFLTGIPYSEHSSFLEMKRFVQWLQPLKIIPTVNNGSWASRKAMEKCFSEWLVEARAKR